MLDALRHGLDVAKHHRRCAGEAERMRRVHHTHPFARHRLERGDFLAHPVHQDFPATARQTTQACRREVAQDVLHRFAEELLECNQFAGAEAMHVDLREFLADVRQQIEIPLLGQLGMMPALHQDLGAAQGQGLLDLFVHLVMGDDVGIDILLRTPEGAELAIDIADVGVVHIAVHDVGDHLVAPPAVRARAQQLPPPIRQRAQLLQRQRVKAQRLGGVHPPAVPDLFQQLIQRDIVNHGWNLEGRSPKEKGEFDRKLVREQIRQGRIAKSIPGNGDSSSRGMRP